MAHKRLSNLGGLPGQDVDHPGRKPNFLHYFGEFEGGQRGVTRGFQYNGITHCQGRCNLPGQHEQGKVPGNNLSHDTHRLVTRQLGGHQLRPTGVIIEVARNERDIQVAGLADRFAIIH